MGSFSIWHWLIVLVVVILIFGTKKLRNMGSDVGGAVNEFKKAINDGKASELSTEKAEIATAAVEKPKAETKVTTRKPAAKTATKSAAKPTAKAKVPTKTSTTAAKKPATKTTAKKAPAKPKLDV